jgi:hypothetical protein
VTGEIKAIRTKRMKLPKTADFFSAFRINLSTLSMNTYPSPSEIIKIAWGRWGETAASRGRTFFEVTRLD